MENDGIAFLAPGKAELLMKIRSCGSLKKAAEEMKMSYRKAWYSIKKINESAPEIMVIMSRGGKDGGKAQLTQAGENLVTEFIKLQAETKSVLSEKTKIFMKQINNS